MAIFTLVCYNDLNQCSLLPRMYEGKPLYSSVVVFIIREVYILHTLFFVTTINIINRERSVVQHSVCVSEIFSLSLTTSIFHCTCSGVFFFLHLGTINDTHTHNRYDPSGRRIGLRRHFYLIIHHTPKRQASMLPLEFEPAIGTSEQPLTQALEDAATGVQKYNNYGYIFIFGLVTRILMDHSWEDKIGMYSGNGYSASNTRRVYLLLHLHQL